MPTNTDLSGVAPGANGARIDLSKAPGSEINFDDLFPVDSANLSTPQTSTGTTPPEQAQPVNEWYLKSPDGKIVYRTPEDAINGISHKDALIAKNRAFLESQGFDPDSFQQVRQPERPQAQPQTPPTGPKYLNHGKQYYNDLSDAVTRGDADAYERVQRQYQFELIQNEFGPAVPLLNEVARNRAVRRVSEELPDFGNFVSSAEYRQTIDSLPRLKGAIDAAENNLQMADSLDELYKLAYLANQGSRRKTEPVVAQTAPVQTQPPQRATMSSSALTPPSPGVNTRNWSTDRASRQQLIKDYEARGIQDVPFSIEGNR